MAKEIERRWKYNSHLPKLDSLEKFITRRCFTEVMLFNAGPDLYFRYRFNKGEDTALFTIKKGTGLERKEYNKRIPLDEYENIKSNFGENLVEYSTGIIEFDGFEYEFKFNGKDFVIEREFFSVESANNFNPSEYILENFFEITRNSEYNLFKFLGLK